jgi:hypothetical protein
VSMKPVAINCHRYQRDQWKICHWCQRHRWCTLSCVTKSNTNFLPASQKLLSNK